MITVDNADVHAVFTTRGAVLKSWQLKKYRDEQNRPLEMIAGHAPADSPLPLTLAVDDAALAAKLAAAPFTLTSETAAGGAPWRAQFDYADDAGTHFPGGLRSGDPARDVHADGLRSRRHSDQLDCLR